MQLRTTRLLLGSLCVSWLLLTCPGVATAQIPIIPTYETLDLEYFQNEAGFARGLDVDGDLAVVGAPGGVSGPGSTTYDDRVKVFLKTADGWSSSPADEIDPPGENTRFGLGVAVSGNRIMVGAPTDDGPLGCSLCGRIYFYERFPFGPTTYVETASIPGSSVDGIFYLGENVDLDGNVAVAAGYGGAWVYAWDGSTWNHVDVLQPPGLGTTIPEVAVQGGTIILTDPFSDMSGASDGGAVFVYQRVGATNQWEIDYPVLFAQSPAEDEYLGFDVALWRTPGDLLSTSYLAASTGSGSSVTIWKRGPFDADYVHHQTLTPPGIGTFSGFIAGDFGALLVGSADAYSQVFYYARLSGSSTWQPEGRFLHAPFKASSGFGKGLATDGTTLLSAAPAWTPGSNYDEVGQAWVLPKPVIFTDAFESGDLSWWSGSEQ